MHVIKLCKIFCFLELGEVQQKLMVVYENKNPLQGTGNYILGHYFCATTLICSLPFQAC